jgi:diguanylate cyclase (GGDEF)-like protein
LAISCSEPNRQHKGHYIGVFNDITQQKASEERIQHLALYDPLTDLPNRRLFKEHLEQAIREAKRNNHWVALLYIDLDRFKNINDSLGHTAGDNLLKVIAERLSFVVRTSDLVARLGGDEFVVILSGLPADRGSVARIEKLTMQLQQAITQPCFLDPEQVFVSASIGVSLYPRDSNEINALISNADTAMYHAKEQGRNNAQFFSSQMNLEATRRLVMQGHLRDALERQEFELYFQPQFPIDSEQLIGFEALVRWHHPDGHLSLPLEFITLAEETGQILPIGEWILGNAFEQMVEWYAQGFENLKLSVNISPHQLRSPGFIQAFETMLNTSGVPVMCLQLEIKEGSLIGQFDHELEALQQIRDMGVSLVLDDFCTGDCALGHLTRLSVDAIKIHKSFIDQMAGNQNTSMLVKAIVTMANGLGLQTVAEGVERPEQIERLRAMGCAAVQGNLTGRSMPVEAAGGLLRARGVASAKSSIN